MESLYNWLHVCVKICLVLLKKKGIHVFVSWTNTPVQESLEFCVHLDMSQIGIVCSTKICLGISKFRIIKKISRFYFFQRETCEKDFKTMKNENFKIPRPPFCKIDDSAIWLISKWMQNFKLARRFSFLNRGVSSRKASM